MSAPDDWLTKAEVATALGCDERTVERKARQGLLGAQGRPGFPTRYNPADVARLAVAGRTGVRPVIVASDATSNGNGHGAVAHQRVTSSAVDGLFIQVLQAALSHLSGAPTGATGPTPEKVGSKLFLTLRQASALSGLPQADLRRLIHEGDLECRTTGRGGIRIRRKDLEAL